ncbi:MAG: peptidoglycan endopeptidase [Pseudomonadota bacterium]
MSGARAVAAARGAIGTRFRLHGRAADTGLDCIGLAALALRATGWEGVPPTGYAMRSGDAERAIGWAAAAGLLSRATPAPGDVLLCRAGPGQLHLAVWTGAGVVHADAMLRRVVERPAPLPWMRIACWYFAGV